MAAREEVTGAEGLVPAAVETGAVRKGWVAGTLDNLQVVKAG